MKTKADPYPDAPALEAVLTDEAFSSFADSVKHAGVQAVRRRRHFRQVRITLGQLACIIGVLALFWLSCPKPQRVATISTATAQSRPDAASHYISEDQMLAMFPSGSCVVAEVNGRKELVFLDQKPRDQLTQ